MSKDTKTESTGPVVLCILDGWGHRDDPTDNAIAMARAPNWRELSRSCPQSLIQTSGLAVGLRSIVLRVHGTAEEPASVE